MERELKPASLVVVDEEPTDPGFGSQPDSRSLSELLEYGIIPLDKPRGPTSHEVVAWVRRLLGVSKAGHSGTLDPAVSGLLPIGLGQATKALTLLLMFPKEYWAVMRIHSSVPREAVDACIREFTGEIYQRPPQRSSVRRDVRTRTIYELEVVEQEGNLFLVRCLCQAGTYVRKLVYDIGEVLGVGATMVELRRTKVGPIDEREGLVNLHELSYAQSRLEGGGEAALRNAVRPVERYLRDMRRVVIRDSAVDAICHGARLAIPGILSLSGGLVKGDTTVILTGKGELVAIGEALMTTEEITGAQKGLAFSVRRVVMKLGTYPKLWKTEQLPKPS
ncbi:MAG: RNA-guided pseudouridylation complex pseudouridine synthase subunit Cbf5 [Thaumarchaeota archaeon]|nr:MAG: RNA-guided pseudouridylation complex pseudouridine synthase subunit Cbf5 [Nitrososphaerota archaeon]